jgi:alcohol dehydrogenase
VCPSRSRCAPSSCAQAGTWPISAGTAPAVLHLESLWIKNVTITTGLVDTYSTPTLLRMLAAEQIDTTQFVTHRFGIGEMLEGYDVFSQAADTGALKVVLFRT